MPLCSMCSHGIAFTDLAITCGPSKRFADKFYLARSGQYVSREGLHRGNTIDSHKVLMLDARDSRFQEHLVELTV